MNTSEEEKLLITKELRNIENNLSIKILEYESKLMEAHSSIIKTEAGGQSWLQRNWRPIVMLSFLILVVCDSFDLLAFRLADQAWTLLQIGLGGYVIGRSAEKNAPVFARKRKENIYG